jgi:hypothetical protein
MRATEETNVLVKPLRSASLTAAAAVLVAGCGAAHPGAAADVDGYRIEMDTVNEQAAALCLAPRLLGIAEGQRLDRSSSRRAVVGVKVQLRMAELAADELGIEVPAPQVTEDELFSQGIPIGEYSESETEAMLEFWGEFRHMSELIQQISLQLREETGVEGAELDSEVFAFLEEQVDDVDIDPRVGLEGDLTPTSPSGSLSVPVSDLAQPPAATGPEPQTAEEAERSQSFVSGLPASQTCG